MGSYLDHYTMHLFAEKNHRICGNRELPHDPPNWGYFAQGQKLGRPCRRWTRGAQLVVGSVGATASYTLKISGGPWAGPCAPQEVPKSYWNKMM